jgi:hypothetical protein
MSDWKMKFMMEMLFASTAWNSINYLILVLNPFSGGERYKGKGVQGSITMLPDIAHFFNQKKTTKLGKYSAQQIQESMNGEMPKKFVSQFVS